MSHIDTIAVLDFGGQYAHLIANRIRRLNVYSEILDAETPAEKLKNFKGIILSGGPQSVYDPDSIKCDPEIFRLGIPILGICYGHQLLVQMEGGMVEPGTTKEFGLSEIKITKAEGILQELSSLQTVWMSHGDTVKALPPGYESLACTVNDGFSVIGNFKKNFYGIQFHAEVTHTLSGMKIFDNFLHICGVTRDWKIENFIEQEMAFIKAKVADKKVFMLVSGGVDSTVAFTLLSQALGEDRVHGLFVDTGFLRLNERQQVEESLRQAGFQNLQIEDASKLYFDTLKEVYDPEAKRKIIGDLFLKVQEKVTQELHLNPEEWLLGQGTIYPDTIESGGTKYAAKIKTHHNRVQQIQELLEQGKVIEPLAQLYKDEVRQVGEKLGLPEKMVWRHPFPGPGLAVRCLCVQEETYPHNYQLLEKKINESLVSQKLAAKVLPIQSVGVQGDFRTYSNPLAISGDVGFAQLGELATTLINQHKEINRVVWMLYPAKIKSVQVHRSYLTPKRIILLQKADAVVNNFIEEHGLSRKIWQFPTVLIPVSINQDFGEAIVLRPVESEEAMTANFYPMDLELLKKLHTELKKIEGITAVFYDVTNKPPGTIEWE